MVSMELFFLGGETGRFFFGLAPRPNNILEIMLDVMTPVIREFCFRDPMLFHVYYCICFRLDLLIELPFAAFFFNNKLHCVRCTCSFL